MTSDSRRALLGLALIAATSACTGSEDVPVERVAAERELAAHSAEFERGVVRVTDGVHVAIGYGLANSILLEGDDGVVIVDTMESAEAARDVRAAFDAITTKPVRAIIYTHNHADHVFGAEVMAAGARPQVWAHATMVEQLGKVLNLVRPIHFERGMRQFGTYLAAEDRPNCGIGPFLMSNAETTPAYLAPTHTFDAASERIELAGLEIVLLHAPGETPDQIVVWLPQKRVLLAADNFYKSFPNLYAIRGTAYRDVMLWVRSLDAMRALRPAFLVPSHTRPITGEGEIAVALGDYRDAIQFVHDQTVRLMNKGLGPDEIVERVRLPESLAAKPYLREYYGRVDWSVRSIFTGYLGWFGGDAVDLAPVAPRTRAEKLFALAGGEERVLEQARAALAADDPQWALELAGHLRAAGSRRAAAQAAEIRAGALRALGARQLSANARNYYLTQARETLSEVSIEPPEPSSAPAALLQAFPIASFMYAMAANLDPENAADVDTVVGFRFPDVKEEYTLHVRNSVAEVRPSFPVDPELTVTADSTVWKEILARKRNAAAAIATGEVAVEGGKIDLARFLLLFR